MWFYSLSEGMQQPGTNFAELEQPLQITQQNLI